LAWLILFEGSQIGRSTHAEVAQSARNTRKAPPSEAASMTTAPLIARPGARCSAVAFSASSFLEVGRRRFLPDRLVVGEWLGRQRFAMFPAQAIG
jgi:hypothetical protein